MAVPAGRHAGRRGGLAAGRADLAAGSGVLLLLLEEEEAEEEEEEEEEWHPLWSKPLLPAQSGESRDRSTTCSKTGHSSLLQWLKNYNCSLT